MINIHRFPLRQRQEYTLERSPVITGHTHYSLTHLLANTESLFNLICVFSETRHKGHKRLAGTPEQGFAALRAGR